MLFAVEVAVHRLRQQAVDDVIGLGLVVDEDVGFDFGPQVGNGGYQAGTARCAHGEAVFEDQQLDIAVGPDQVEAFRR